MIKTEEFHGYCAFYMIHMSFQFLTLQCIPAKLTVKTQKIPYIVAFFSNLSSKLLSFTYNRHLCIHTYIYVHNNYCNVIHTLTP